MLCTCVTRSAHVVSMIMIRTYWYLQSWWLHFYFPLANAAVIKCDRAFSTDDVAFSFFFVPELMEQKERNTAHMDSGSDPRNTDIKLLRKAPIGTHSQVRSVRILYNYVYKNKTLLSHVEHISVWFPRCEEHEVVSSNKSVITLQQLVRSQSCIDFKYSSKLGKWTVLDFSSTFMFIVWISDCGLYPAFI